ncbi:MAG: DUF3276 family protein [Bacteroidales bacterium]
MNFEDFDKADKYGRSGDDVYSKSVRAGKRTYFFDVKATKNNDYYLTITESKRRIEKDGKFAYDKHKVFLYKEDFEKFSLGLEEVIQFIQENNPSNKENLAKESTTTSFTDVKFEEL